MPIVSLLRGELLRHRMRCGRPTTGLVFPGGERRPFYPATIQRRADRAWKDAGLSRVTCHEARHTFASYSIAAGVNAKTLCTYMGHGSIQITYDRYGHLMPGNEREAASLLDAFLGVDEGTETG